MPTITLLARANRSGTFSTPSFAVASNATGPFTLRTNMLNSQLVAAGRSGSLTVEVSSDGGVSWNVFGGLTWDTGANTWVVTHPTSSGDPGFGALLDSLRGKLIRATVTLSSTTSVGIVIEAP